MLPYVWDSTYFNNTTLNIVFLVLKGYLKRQNLTLPKIVLNEVFKYQLAVWTFKVDSKG